MLTIVSLIVCALIFAISVFYQRLLISSVHCSDSSFYLHYTGERLSETATIMMVFGMQCMEKKMDLIRKMLAVQTLRSTIAIYSDKTVPLTLNKMTVLHIAVNGDFE